jgi:hypothetical protein
VNSGELVLNNSDQQSKLYGQMNSRWWCWYDHSIVEDFWVGLH